MEGNGGTFGYTRFLSWPPCATCLPVLMVIPFLSHFLPFLFDIIANQTPTRGVSLFNRSNFAFRLCSRHEIACHFIETQILCKLFDTSVDFFGIFRLTPKLLLAFCDFFSGDIIFKILENYWLEIIVRKNCKRNSVILVLCEMYVISRYECSDSFWDWIFKIIFVFRIFKRKFKKETLIHIFLYSKSFLYRRKLLSASVKRVSSLILMNLIANGVNWIGNFVIRSFNLLSIYLDDQFSLSTNVS